MWYPCSSPGYVEPRSAAGLVILSNTYEGTLCSSRASPSVLQRHAIDVKRLSMDNPFTEMLMAMQATDDNAEGSEARFEAYCEEVEKSAAWGGQLELEALSKAYERHITVFSVGMPPVEMGKEFGGKHLCHSVAKVLQIRYLQSFVSYEASSGHSHNTTLNCLS